MIIFEFSAKYKGCGKYISTFGGEFFWRIWLGFVAVTITGLNLKETHDYISYGRTKWVK